MIPGSKVINHDALAHEWLYDLMTRPNMRIKVGYIPHDIRILGRIVEVRSAKQSVGIIVGGDPNIITSHQALLMRKAVSRDTT